MPGGRKKGHKNRSASGKSKSGSSKLERQTATQPLRLLPVPPKTKSLEHFTLISQLLFHAHNGSVEGVQATLALGKAKGYALARDADYDLRSGLHLACCEGQLEIAKILLAARADVNVKDRWGNSPLDDAINHHHPELLVLLEGAPGESPPGPLAEVPPAASPAHSPAARMQLSIDAQAESPRASPKTSSGLPQDPVQSLPLEKPPRKLRPSAQNPASPNPSKRPPKSTSLGGALRRIHSDPVYSSLGPEVSTLIGAKSLMSGDIWAAAAFGSIDTINALLQAGVDVNKLDYDRRTALHAAASLGRLPIVQFLLSKSADVGAVDRWGQTPLDEAIANNQREVLQLLLEQGASAEHTGDAPPRAWAAPMALQGLNNPLELASGHDLCSAAALDDKAKIQQLVGEGVNINTPNYDKRTALHLAAAHGKVELIEFLIELKAMVNLEDRWQRTPLDDATAEGQLHAVAVLKRHGGASSPHTIQENKEQQGYQLCQAARQGDLAALQQLLDRHVTVNQVDYDKRTALHLAASEGKVEAIELLIARKANVNARDRWDFTPLQEAIRGNVPSDIIKLLEQRGGKVFENGALMTLSQSSCLQEGHWQIRPDEVARQHNTILGRGAYGEVYLARWRGTLVAVKVLRGDLESKNMNLKAVLSDFRLEVSVMRQLNHPNIVQFFGAHLQMPLMLVQEYMPGGCLSSVLKQYTQHGRSMPPKLALRYASHIARGMMYLHSHNPPIIHRDLKPSNLLIDQAGNLKITDFGLAKVLMPYFKKEDYTMTGETGSYRYMAPEVYRHQPYSETVDQYSFAVILWEMLEGQPAFGDVQAKHAAQMAEAGRRPAFEEDPPADASKKGAAPKEIRYWPGVRRLISMCWDEDPSVRPSFEDLVEALDHIRDWPNWKDKNATENFNEFEARSKKNCSLM